MHVLWRQLRKESSLYSLPCSIVGSLAVRFCSFAVLFFICDPASAVVLRMSSVTPGKRSVLCWVFSRNWTSVFARGMAGPIHEFQQSMELESQLCSTLSSRRQTENLPESATERGLYEETLHCQDGWYPWRWQDNFSLVCPGASSRSSG